MSSNLPPTGPPPSTPPPPNPPGQPEYLSASGGGPVPSSSAGGGGKKTAIIAGGALVGLGAVAAGGWFAWAAFFGTGPQPAEVLPASTLGYLSADLDPSGEQKLEALRTLEKFPGLDEQLDLAVEGDLREYFFDESIAASCEGIEFEDIDDWLGNRFAVAAVDIGAEEPVVVGVAQVTDAEDAQDGVETLDEECGGGENTGYVIQGGWMLLGENQGDVDDVADAVADGSLADDADFQKWTDEAGGPGILTGYASPLLGEFLRENEDLAGEILGSEDCGGFSDDPFGDGSFDEDLFDEDFYDDFECEPTPVPDELVELYTDFGGAAFQARFDDGSLELEFAADATIGGLPEGAFGDQADDLARTLPADTAAVMSASLGEGWLDSYLALAESFLTPVGSELPDTEEMIEELEAETGLEIPEDVETLAGEALSLSVSSDVDAEAMVNSSGPADVPVGLKIRGDADDITDVLDQLTEVAGPEAEEFIVDETADDVVAIAPNEDYRKQLLEDGGLGDNDVFSDVVREDDLALLFFVNFDEGDWLTELVADFDAEVAENIDPLSGLGLSSWVDGDTAHGVLRITTDKD